MSRALLFGTLHVGVVGMWKPAAGQAMKPVWILSLALAGLLIAASLRGTARICFGLTVGITFGTAVGIALGTSRSFATGNASGFAGWVAGGIACGFVLASMPGIWSVGVGTRPVGTGLVIVAMMTVAILELIGGAIYLRITEMTTYSLAGWTAFVFGAGIAALRAYYYLPHLFLVWPAVHGRWYPHHPVAWDDTCLLPFPGLDRLLLAYAEHAPEAAENEVERLISTYPSQRMNALRARAALVAREAGDESELAQLPFIVGRLPEGDKGFLAQTPRIREMVNEIGRIQVRLNTIDRPVLQEPTAQLLFAEIEWFIDQVAGFREPLASEFRAAGREWRRVAGRQLHQVRAVVNREPTPQVFRAGDPVDRSQEAFVPRNSVFGELERQIMLSTGCPGLVLYGRRRVGKSTVLRNVSGFIPTSVRIATVSMQDPWAFTSVETLVTTIAGAIRNAGGKGSSAGAQLPRDLPEFFNFLSSYDSALKDSGERLLLAVDEYENIDVKIGKGVFPEDLLATLRESMQRHRHVTWVLTGSHEVAELKHAPWNSYLVSARTVEVLPFSEAETRLLLTEPLKYSSMWSRDDAKRPRFSASFWGEGGIERIHGEAGGWPHLVQLIAEMAVDLINDTEQLQIDSALLEEALDKAIVRGDTVLRELMEQECGLPGEWEYLRGFRVRDLQAPPEDEAVYRSLRRRLLVCDENGEWRLRVPLMQRWLRVRG